jgi:hypothetical protein
MRGWIYVISNKAMPGLVKVGYSSKDPEERAQELDHTGTPHPYVVEYDILIEGELYQVEQRIHQNLSSYSEGKEWFRCEPEQAVIAIRQVAKDIAIAESFKKVDRESAERLQQERDIEVTREQQRRTEALGLIDKGKACEASGQYWDALFYYTEAETKFSDTSATRLRLQLQEKIRGESKKKGEGRKWWQWRRERPKR